MRLPHRLLPLLLLTVLLFPAAEALSQNATTLPDPGVLRMVISRIYRQQPLYLRLKGGIADRTPTHIAHLQPLRAWHGTDHVVAGDSVFIEQVDPLHFKYVSSLLYDASWEDAGNLCKKWTEDVLPAAFPGIEVDRYTRGNTLWVYNFTDPKEDSLSATLILRTVKKDSYELRLEIGTPQETSEGCYRYPEDVGYVIPAHWAREAEEKAKAEAAVPKIDGVLTPVVDGYRQEKRALGDFTGYGNLVLANGDVYSGDFRNGKFHGNGTYTYANGDFYFGAFADNQFSGVGMLKKLKSGYLYSGRFANNAPIDGQVSTNDPAYSASTRTSGGGTSSSSSTGGYSGDRPAIGSSYSGTNEHYRGLGSNNGSSNSGCSYCNGSGSITTSGSACTTCRGTGRNGGRYVKDGYGGSTKWEAISCVTCSGKGYTGGTRTCSHCGGTGR